MVVREHVIESESVLTWGGGGGGEKEFCIYCFIYICLHVNAAHFAHIVCCRERERDENEKKKKSIIIICKALLLCFTIHDTVHVLNI